MKIIRLIPLFVLTFLTLTSCGGGVADGSANIVTPTTNQPPVANAGIDQRASFGTGPVTLDGSTSSGTEGVTLTYAWVITTAPTGSTAMLSGAASAKPSFTPDKTGLYIFQLTVSDGLASATDEVELDVAANGVPIAKAGPDQDVGFGAQVTFDGSASSDPEHRPLTYTWIQVPGYGPDVTGGSGSLTGVTVNFTAPPTAATVLFDLRVNDGLGDSFADRVQVYVLKNPSKAVFVSLTGNDGSPGTRAQPKRSLSAAITAAALLNSGDVYAAIGTYSADSSLALINGVSLFGGYDAANAWRRGVAQTGFSTTARIGVVATNIVAPTALDQFSIVASAATAAGDSSYGVFAVASPGLTIRKSRIVAGNGARGSNAAKQTKLAQNAANGALGQGGCENSGALGCSSCARPTPGGGGNGWGGRNGGRGGLPGLGSAAGSAGLAGLPSGASGGLGIGAGHGNWNPTSTYWGYDGAFGANGQHGVAGTSAYSASGHTAVAGSNGLDGAAGQAGGGGGGGGGGTTNCDSYGGAGAGGGGAGGPGFGGYGGGTGGGSFAIYLWNSNSTIDATALVAGLGGNGGDATPGTAGGLGGKGARVIVALPNLPPVETGAGNSYGGSSEQDDGSNGARGGDGGNGGNGGAGGGGAGGPSIGFLLGNGSLPNATNVTYSIGTAGVGGASAGNPGPAGARANSKTP